MKQLFKYLLLLLLTLSTGHLYAQLQGQAKIDSLLKELPKQKEDTNKVKLLERLSRGYSTIKPDEGIKYGQQELELSTKIGWKKGIGMANTSLGVNYGGKSDYAKALEYYQVALKVDEEIGEKKGIAVVNCNAGLVYNAQGDNKRALECYFKALKLFEECGSKENCCTALNNIGTIYCDQGNYPRALEFFFKALHINEELGDKHKAAFQLSNIGLLYMYQKDYPKALEYDFKALKIFEEAGDIAQTAGVTGNIGLVYSSQKDYSKALEYKFKSLKMDEEMSNKNGIARNTGDIGNVFLEQKNYTMAIDYMLKSLKICEEIGDKEMEVVNCGNIATCFLAIINDSSAKSSKVNSNVEPSGSEYQPTNAIPIGKAALLRETFIYLQRALTACKEISGLESLMRCYNSLAEAYKLSGDYKKAMEYADRARIIKDSVFSQENREKIAKMEDARKEYGDSLKAADAKIAADVKAQHRRNYELVGGGVLILALGFIFILTRNNKLLGKEKKQSENLLLNILPEEVATQLKQTGAATARNFDNVTVLFTDFVNFTEASGRMKPEALIEELDTCFKKFDAITGKYNIEKIKTIGDAYLAVCGLPHPNPEHAANIVRAAQEINAFMQDREAKLGNNTFKIRIGIHTGSVIAGIVGDKKFAYDIWGDTVNTAARMEQSSEAGKINISQTTYELVKDKIDCDYRGEIDAKGKGVMKMYFVQPV